LRIAFALRPHFEPLAAHGHAAELPRVLLATAKAELVFKPLLLPLFLAIRRVRQQLTAPEVVSCIWSLYTLDFCKPKFRRTLGERLLHHVKNREIAPRALSDVLPALSTFGYWERLPNSLRRSIWRLSSEELRRYATPPPQKPSTMSRALVNPPTWEEVQKKADDRDKGWRLPSIEKNFFRRQMLRTERPGGQLVAVTEHLEPIPGDASDAVRRERQEERDLLRKQHERSAASFDGTRQVDEGEKAIEDFVELVKRM